jgi:Na+/melibiose symporter-like transporter
MGEPYDYIFDQDNYTNVAPWLYYVVVVVLIFPAIYLGYPLLLVYRYIINMLIELCEEAMNLPLREEHANQDTKAKRSRHQEQSSNE